MFEINQNKSSFLMEKIWETHNIIWTSPILNSIEEAEVFIFCENHNDLDLKTSNSNLIHKIIEIKNSKIEDASLVLEIDKNTSIDHIEKLKEIKSFQYLSTLPSSIKCIGWDDRSHELKYSEYIEKAGQIIDCVKFIKKQKKNAVDAKSILVKSLTELNNKYPVCSHAFVVNNENVLFKITEIYKEYLENICNTFQKRNNSLIKTLQETRHVALRFVIGGTAHFIQASETDERLSVKPLYIELNKMKACVLQYSKYRNGR